MKSAFNHPFRIFFPLSALAAFIALLPWLSLLFAPRYAALFPLDWHAFSFIELMGSAAFAGFLLTALPAWCHFRPPLWGHSCALLGLWFWALWGLPDLHTAAGRLCLFWGYLWGLAAWIMLRTRVFRHGSFLGVLAALMGLCVALALHPSGHLLHTTVDVMAVGIVLAHFRIGVAVGNQALKDCGQSAWQFIPNPFLKNLSVLLLSLATAAALVGVPRDILAWLYLAAALMFAARLNDWHSLYLLHAPYVRIHYAVGLVLFVGYAALAVVLLAAPQYYSNVRHFLAIAVYLLMILTVMSIAGLRHSGLPLRFFPDTRLAAGLLLLAGLSRALFSALHPALWSIYGIPALSIAAAFALWLGRYLPIFKRTQPR